MADSFSCLVVRNIGLSSKDNCEPPSKLFVKIIYNNTEIKTSTKNNVESFLWTAPIAFPVEDAYRDVLNFKIFVYENEDFRREDILAEETVQVNTVTAEKGTVIEMKNLKLHCTISRCSSMQKLKETFSKVDEMQIAINKVYSSFRWL